MGRVWVAITRAVRQGWGYPVVGVVVMVLGVGQTVAGTALPAALAGCLSAACGVAVLRRHLAVGFVLVWVSAFTLQLTTGSPPFGAFVAVLVAVYSLARYGSRRTQRAGLAVVLVSIAAMAWLVWRAATDGPFGVVIVGVYLGVATLVGVLARRAAEVTDAVLDRNRALERERDRTAELAATAERVRLARELHDVVSHGVSLMVLQAEGAREVWDRHPEQTPAALDSISLTGRRAISELRDMLDLLHEPGDGRTHALGELVDLIDLVRSTGLIIEVAESGAPADIPGRVWPTVERVVQEALTNVLKHAGASRVLISARFDIEEIRLQIDDDGRPYCRPAPGHGLSGMAQRVAELGGRLEFGPADAATGAGFRLSMTLPRRAAP